VKGVKALRATFEDVLANQERLRKWLDRLVEENRPLKPEERGAFMQLVARAMLGQGSAIKLTSRFGEPVPQIWRSDELVDSVMVENAEDFLRCLAYWGEDSIQMRRGGEKERTVPISEAWKEARQLALRTFPLALAQAAQISPERIPYRGTEAKRV